MLPVIRKEHLLKCFSILLSPWRWERSEASSSAHCWLLGESHWHRRSASSSCGGHVVGMWRAMLRRAMMEAELFDAQREVIGLPRCFEESWDCELSHSVFVVSII